MTNDFRIGRGRFEYLGAAGASHTGFPGNVACRIGSVDHRAAMRVGNCYVINTTTVFGPGLASFDAWLSELRIGKPSAGWEWHNTASTLDLRGVTVTNLDVDGAVTIGIGINDESTIYLSSGAMRCSTLSIGRDADTTLSCNKVSTLDLSNSVVTVTNAVLVGETGRIVATLAGKSSGLDLLTTNLTLAPPDVTFTQFCGHIALTFATGPVEVTEFYFGLRVAGNVTNELHALHDAVPSQLTWDTNGLSSAEQARFGIHYIARRDFTVVGVLPRVFGTLFVVR